jgi:hypothetical protein
VPIPFSIGRWKGVDGSTVVAALKPGDYVTRIRSDISVDPQWSNDPTPLGTDRQVLFRYFGTGDIGGAPDAGSLDWLEKAMAHPTVMVHVCTTSDTDSQPAHSCTGIGPIRTPSANFLSCPPSSAICTWLIRTGI